MRYMVRPSAFYTSYLAGVGTCTNGNRWCGLTDNDIVKCVTGKNCSDARTQFCKQFGKGGNCIGLSATASGSPNVGVAKPVGGSASITKAALGGDNNPVAKASDSIGKAIDTGISGKTDPNDKNPVSGCPNCGPDWLNPGQWGCVLFSKPICEFQAAANGGWNGLVKFFGDNALWIVGGGLVAIVVLTAITKRM